ncbi:MAG: DUF1329 domain-containing protein [Comamonas sp.]
MKCVMTKTALAMAASLIVAVPVHAKVSASEAEQLGKELTCVGAIKAGNKEGTIPEFTGKWLGAPPGVRHNPQSGEHPVDIYADEKPLFVITAANVDKYADKLSPGQKAMFQKYPKTMQIPVYKGHRDFRYSDEVCAAIKKNATTAETVTDGLGIKTLGGAISFPFPKSGIEAYWNVMLPTRAYTEENIADSANVLSDGSVTFGRNEIRYLAPPNNPAEVGKPVEGVSAYTITKVQLPEREKGSVTISSDPFDYGKFKRLAWQYDPGTRRVRQLPEFGFDQPLPGTGGKMTIDSDRLINGSAERYNWKLVGKQEMFIPANAYRLHQPTIKYKDLLTPGHANPEFLRYELRRVWVLEGTLKEGFRHIYGKRVMFADEDTGQAVAGDMYDARGQLWQHAFINMYYSYDINAWHAGTSFYHDLNAGSYLAYTLFQERPKGPILNRGGMTPSMFTPEAARNAGN